MREKMSDIKAERDKLRSEAYDLRAEKNKANDRYSELSKEFEEFIKSYNLFMKGMILHLTSKPVKSERNNMGNIKEETWKEAGVSECDFRMRFQR